MSQGSASNSKTDSPLRAFGKHLKRGTENLIVLLLLFATVTAIIHLPAKLRYLESTVSYLANILTPSAAASKNAIEIVATILLLIAGAILGGETLWGIDRLKSWEHSLIHHATMPLVGRAGPLTYGVFRMPFDQEFPQGARIVRTPIGIQILDVPADRIHLLKTGEGNEFLFPFGTILRNFVALAIVSSVALIIALPTEPAQQTWLGLSMFFWDILQSLGLGMAALANVAFIAFSNNLIGVQAEPVSIDAPASGAAQPVSEIEEEDASFITVPDFLSTVTLLFISAADVIAGLLTFRRQTWYIVRDAIEWTIKLPFVLLPLIYVMTLRLLRTFKEKGKFPWLVSVFALWLLIIGSLLTLIKNLLM